jgi:hypothetical protein
MKKTVTLTLEFDFTAEDWDVALEEFGGEEGVLDMIKNEVSHDFPDEVRMIGAKLNE